MLAECLGIDPDDAGDLGFGNAIAGECFHLTTGRQFGSVSLAPHQTGLLDTSLGNGPADSAAACSIVRDA